MSPSGHGTLCACEKSILTKTQGQVLMLHRVDQLKVTLTDVEYDMREMDLGSVWGNYLQNAATVSKPVCVCTRG